MQPFKIYLINTMEESESQILPLNWPRNFPIFTEREIYLTFSQEPPTRL